MSWVIVSILIRDVAKPQKKISSFKKTSCLNSEFKFRLLWFNKFSILQFKSKQLQRYTFRWIKYRTLVNFTIVWCIITIIFQKAQLKKIGGRDSRSAVRLALNAIFTKEVQGHYSKDVMTGKMKFSITNNYKCLIGIYLIYVRATR